MELDLESFKRDWIVGTSGREFSAKVQFSADRLTALSEEQRLRGVLITEANPVEFAAGFFGAVMTQTPIILGNPNWGERERAEFYKLVSPAIFFVGASLVTPAEPKSRTTAGVTSDAPTIKPGSILIPTGGTTGGVKLAIHDWSSLSVASAGVQAFLGGGPIDSCCLLPLYHVSGLMQLVRSFLSDGRIRFDDAEVAGYCLSLVPTQLQRLLSDVDSIQKMNTARAIFVGGAAMPAAVAATIHQDLAVAPDMSIYQNIFMGAERTRSILGLRLLDKRRMREEALGYMAQLNGSLTDMDAKVNSLSGGQRQAVAICRALMWNANVVILDEPTAALGVRETEHVLELLRSLKSAGKTVILISHSMTDIAAVADRVSILRTGENQITLDSAGLTADSLSHYILSGEVNRVP